MHFNLQMECSLDMQKYASITLNFQRRTGCVFIEAWAKICCSGWCIRCSRTIFRSNRFFTCKEWNPRWCEARYSCKRKNIPGHVRKYNVPEASEVAALIVGELPGKLNIVLKRSSEYDANRFEKQDFIKLGYPMYNPLADLLLFPYRKKTSGI